MICSTNGYIVVRFYHFIVNSKCKRCLEGGGLEDRKEGDPHSRKYVLICHIYGTKAVISHFFMCHFINHHPKVSSAINKAF